jgi:peptide/nickel transport system permease protein
MTVEEMPLSTKEPDLELRRKPFRLSLLAKISVAVLVFWIAMAIFGPVIAPFSVYDDPASESLAPPSGQFWLGSDVQYRDTLSLLLHGARIAIGSSLLSAIVAYVVGIPLGFAAAVGGSKLDMVLCRINDAFLSLPTMMTGLVVIAALGSGLPVLIATTGLIYATGVFRVARSIAINVRTMDFVEAAQARGERLPWIIAREIWPNAWMPLLTDFGLRLVFAILFISALSFLGLGVQPPQVDWGSMVRENLVGLSRAAPALLAPAVAIASLTIAINLIVDDVSARESEDLLASLR